MNEQLELKNMNVIDIFHNMDIHLQEKTYDYFKIEYIDMFSDKIKEKIYGFNVIDNMSYIIYKGDKMSTYHDINSFYFQSITFTKITGVKKTKTKYL